MGLAVSASRASGREVGGKAGGRPPGSLRRSICRGGEVACFLLRYPCRPVHLEARGQLAVPPHLSPASGASCLSPDVTLLVSSPGGPRAGLGCPRPCPALASGLRCTGAPAVAPVLTALPLHTPPLHAGPRDAVLLVLSPRLLVYCFRLPVLYAESFVGFIGGFSPRAPCSRASGHMRPAPLPEAQGIRRRVCSLPTPRAHPPSLPPSVPARVTRSFLSGLGLCRKEPPAVWGDPEARAVWCLQLCPDSIWAGRLAG